MKETKLQKEYVDDGFGFPIKLLNVPMVKVRGTWTPDIDYNKLTTEVLKTLARKPTRLTGNEIRFIRLQATMTLVEFGQRFGVTHANVKKWENCGDQATNMQWSTEKDLRLFVALRTLGEATMVDLYRDLTKKRAAKKQTTKFDVQELAIAA